MTERKANNWFAAKGVKPTCPQCGSENFDQPQGWKGRRTNAVGMITAIGRGGTIRGTLATYPLECANCGYLLLFSYEKMGIPRPGPY